MSSTNPHVEIRPKPANEKDNSGAVSQMVTPRRRAGPLVFVNTSDLNTETEKQGNRKMVKKWAMLNRNARYMRPSTSASQKARFLSWDSRGDRETTAGSASTSTSDDGDVSPIVARDALLAAATDRAIAATTLEPNASLTNQLNNLCIELDPWAKTLLDEYLRGSQNDMHLPVGRLVSANRTVFPMLARSPAALCSMVATLASNPSCNRKDYRDYYLSMALKHTNTLIQNMERDPTPVVFFCVSLLLWTSSHTADESAVMAHFTGLTALMIRHWDMFSMTPYLRHGPFFWTTTYNEGLLIPGIAEPSMYSLPTEDHTLTIDLSEFAGLQAQGWVSGDLVSFLPNILAMRALVTRVKRGQLNLDGGRDLFAYICYNARTLTGLESAALSPFEHVIRMCTIIQYYASVFENVAQGVGWLAAPMQAHLTRLDVRELLAAFPRVVLWVALVAGPFSAGSSRTWWMELLGSAVKLLGEHDFDAAVAMCDGQILWTHALDDIARGFWTSALEGSRRDSS